ncbi:MAG: NYN domain-containing protein [Xenococcaceae cyanobacterium MO_167.B27]|nr:NYN domain-containing protein [Xenococcaceae cyanobacterium MO_167.B27]
MTYFNSERYLFSRNLPPTAAILLDVENFALKLDLEQHLQSYCKYPITIKFAVANWRNSAIAQLDTHLHQQRYQLIHVPKEKNAADAQILTLGVSLLLQHPQIVEIAIVSQDSIFDYLHQTLQRQGCKTYKVYQQSGNIYCHSFADNCTYTVSTINNKTKKNTQKTQTSKPSSQELKKILQNKIELTLSKLKRSSVKPVTVSLLSQEFKKDYQQSLSEVIKGNKLDKSVTKFLKKNCTDTIEITQKDNVYYLSLKENK